MKKNLFLSIPEPCAENWENMTPEEKGRHCASCNKTVIDFSKFTDRELIEFMQSVQGKVCGRFSPYQLNRELTSYEPDTIPLWQKIAWGTALATSLAACNSSANSNSNIVQGKIAKSDTSNKRPSTNTSTPIDSYISGVVHDAKSGAPAPHLEVSIKGTKYYSITDAKGNFKIIVPDSVAGKTITLAVNEDKLYEVMAYAYTEMEYTIDKLPFVVNIKMKCTLDEEPPLTGVVCMDPKYVKHDSNYVYSFTDRLDRKPKFKGDMMKYLADKIVYPKELQNKAIEGTVYVGFVIERSGKVGDVKVLKGVTGAPELDSVSVHAIKNMPRWTPGAISDTNVRVQMVVPIKFVLDDDSTKNKK